MKAVTTFSNYKNTSTAITQQKVYRKYNLATQFIYFYPISTHQFNDLYNYLLSTFPFKIS